MASSLSISSSEADSRPPGRRLLFRRVAAFVAPYCVLLVVMAVLALGTGELLSARFVASLASGPLNFIYLDEFSDHSFEFKLASARLRRPEVLVIGGSRVNQWRSAMFAPYEFYNSGNCLYGQGDYRRFLEALGDYSPRVLLFSLDFYTFNPEYDSYFRNVSYSDMGGFGSSERIGIAASLAKRIVKDPMSLMPFQREPLHGALALGLHAARAGTGFRRDGSYQYGAAILGLAGADTASVESAVKRVENGTVPILRADHLDKGQRREFERFAAAARERGITLVAITIPFAPALRQALDKSAQHGIWREFQSAETANWVRQQGVIYFNFSDLSSFGGKADEFVDAFHPSEPAYQRMLIKMLEDPVFAAALPKLDREQLEQRLRNATRFELYYNEF